MRITWILVGIAVLAFGLVPQAMGDNLASGSGVQLDALNDCVGLLIVDQKRLYKLDLPGAKADLLHGVQGAGGVQLKQEGRELRRKTP